MGTWVYPLVKGKSPVLKSRESAYMFPDLDDSLVGKIFLKVIVGLLFFRSILSMITFVEFKIKQATGSRYMPSTY